MAWGHEMTSERERNRAYCNSLPEGMPHGWENIRRRALEVPIIAVVPQESFIVLIGFGSN